MNGAQVAGVEFAGRQRLGEPLRGRLFLEEIQVCLRTQARAVLQDGRSGIAIGVRNRVVHPCVTPSWRASRISRAAALPRSNPGDRSRRTFSWSRNGA